MKMAENDAQWLSSLTDIALRDYIDSGDSVSLADFPAGCKVSIDSRAYSQGVLNIKGLSRTTPHLITLSLQAPGSRIALFLPSLDQGNATVCYDDTTVKLSFALSAGFSANVGERGVAVLPAPARDDWDALASHVCSLTLSAAEVPFGRCVDAPKFAKWPRPRPPAGATVAEITKFGMDASERVRTVMRLRHGDSFDRLLGECQLAFLGFLFMGCVESLTHWVFIVKELCSCFDMFEVDSDCLSKFSHVLCTQLKLVDDDVNVVFRGLRFRDAINEFWQEFNENVSGNEIGVWLQGTSSDLQFGDEDGPTLESTPARNP